MSMIPPFEFVVEGENIIRLDSMGAYTGKFSAHDAKKAAELLTEMDRTIWSLRDSYNKQEKELSHLKQTLSNLLERKGGDYVDVS